ncbi:MAG: phosphoribosylaminoimidazolesuccinocarboxamide synthase [Bryobacterales bacterium]|nr:phosphoribosylaminoimidazolesuccinocarboxamide synthase [Bryobacterales bacterium]
MALLLESDLPGLTLVRRGKVRDVYAVDEERLLIVATDRISAFDVILGSGIPDKGRVLTQISLFWFRFLADIPNHLISTNVDEYPEGIREYREQLEGRSMLVRRARMVDIECVARGYLSGSGWKEYQAQGTICGIPLPAGLRESDRLPAPIFTPATKAQSGHDENIAFEEAAKTVGVKLAGELRDLTLQIYGKAAAYAETRGIILADTKFEFGFVDNKLVLGDEVLTPDSSRFWPRASYQPGGAQPSYDKQFVRDYLESIAWNKQPPGPVLPDEVIERTGNKYKEAYKVLTGKSL